MAFMTGSEHDTWMAEQRKKTKSLRRGIFIGWLIWQGIKLIGFIALIVASMWTYNRFF